MQTDTLDLEYILCMYDFYTLQTEDNDPEYHEVQTYFDKLMDNPLEEDMLVYAAFEAEYLLHLEELTCDPTMH